MSNILPLFITAFILGVSILIGSGLDTEKTVHEKKTVSSVIPSVGRIEVLNGCGIEGAAGKVANFLRSKNFDIKSTANADIWNYPFTIVVSRSLDTTIASQVAAALKTDKMVVIRSNDNLHDVTVFIGPDFGERIQ
ncbi:MAG: LytR C-terminal domain-containing protein [Fibrobacter sp.]|nr:LytR C-terminal domain-containing protein [Fibrobacter sp.]